MRIIFLIFWFQSAFASVIPNHSLIITHASRHYHTGEEAKALSNELIKKSLGPVIALAQKPIQQDLLWYTDIQSISFEFYSHGGEHNMIFPKESSEVNYHLTLIGGYFTACLGRTLSSFVAQFIKGENQLKTLSITLPMKAIFTGHLERQGLLVPPTSYQESILDSSVDGMNFYRVVEILRPHELNLFLQEAVKIGLYKKAPMLNIRQSDFKLEVRLFDHFLYTLGEETADKKVILRFK